VEIELSRAPRGREARLDLARRGAARRQRPLAGDPPAVDEERPDVARVVPRDQDAALETPHVVEALELAADPLERRQAVAQPAGVLEPLRLRQLAETAAQAWQRRLGLLQLVGREHTRRELRGAA